jgi:phosphatidylserine decarboxylase
MPAFLEKPLALLQYLLPQHLLTRLVHWLMRVRVGWVKNALIKTIGHLAGINYAEAASPNPEDYESFNAFFTRELKAGARPIDADERALISPCDGRISEAGSIKDRRIYQAKGHDYTLEALLANDPACEALRHGHFWTIYLSPRDYHRVHMPLAGRLRRMTYVPGQLFSVAPYTARQIPELFARNERVVSVFETEYGPMAVVLVGAMLVAGMDTVWAGTITPSKDRNIRQQDYAAGEVSLARGEEMGRFNMGSTVVMALPPGVVDAASLPGPGAGDPVRMGQRLVMLKQPRETL